MNRSHVAVGCMTAQAATIAVGYLGAGHGLPGWLFAAIVATPAVVWILAGFRPGPGDGHDGYGGQGDPQPPSPSGPDGGIQEPTLGDEVEAWLNSDASRTEAR